MKDIHVSDEIYEALEKNLAAADFKNVDDFAQAILAQAIEDMGVNVSAEDEEKIKEKLQALGYLG